MVGNFFSRIAETGILHVGDRLCLKCGTMIEFVQPEMIYWIEASDQYIRLYSNGKCHVSRMTLSHLEEQLDSSKFVRIHRRAIINIHHIQEVLMKNRKTCYAILSNGAKIRVSRFRKNQLISALGDIRILEK